MDDKNGNGDGFSFDGPQGNPHVSSELCAAFRSHMETKIGTMETKILSVVKLTGAVIAIVLTVVQLGLYFLGG
jgi:hypothetical protein